MEACDSCNDEPDMYDYKKYDGKITFRITKADGRVIELKGNRKEDDKDCVFYRDYSGDFRLRGYSLGSEVGYTYELYMKEGGWCFYTQSSGINDIYNYRLLFVHENRSVVELEERKIKKSYKVEYVFEGEGYEQQTLTVNYKFGDNVLTDELSEIIQTSQEERYNIESSKVEGDSSIEWRLGGAIDVSCDEIFQELVVSQIRVKVKLKADQVKVSLHYNHPSKQDEIKTIRFSTPIDSLWTIQDDTIEFRGWSTSKTEFVKFTGPISNDYKDTPLKLYAFYNKFKSIFIDYGDGVTKEVKIYDDNTFSVNLTGYRGIKEDKNSNSFILLTSSTLYDKLVEGRTYYLQIA